MGCYKVKYFVLKSVFSAFQKNFPYCCKNRLRYDFLFEQGKFCNSESWTRKLNFGLFRPFHVINAMQPSKKLQTRLSQLKL